MRPKPHRSPASPKMLPLLPPPSRDQPEGATEEKGEEEEADGDADGDGNQVGAVQLALKED